MGKMFKNFGFLFLIACFFSCSKDNLTPNIDFKYNFYPLALTKVLVYNVDSIDYRGFAGEPVSYKFQIKDSVANTFTDASNNLAYRIERYKKNENQTLWQYQKTISRTIKTRTAEELIDNKNYIRLVFPTNLGAIWNGNSKNDLLKKEFAVTELLDSYTQNNLQFNKTLTTHFEDTNLIREDIETHIYAENVGLISSEVRAVDLNIANSRIIDGFIYKLKLVSYK